jgi:hypothetical protein
MASTLNEFANDLTDTYTDLKDEAQDALAQATQDLAEAQNDYDEVVAEYAELEKAIADKRAAMSKALMPADIELLASELRDLILQLRKKRVELHDAQEALDAAQRDRDLAERQLKRASSTLSEVQADRVLVEAREERHTEWKQKVSDGDLSDLAATATALLDAATDPPAEEDEEAVKNIKTATTRIAADIPADLLTRARERTQQTQTSLSDDRGLLDDVEDELGGHREANEGATGLVAKRWIAFERAEAAFQDFVVLSESRYQQALSLLKSVAESTELTPAEEDRITEVTLSGGDEEALTKEQARDQAQADVDAKDIEIELAIVQALIADVDADPEDDATVIAKRAELDTLNTTLTDKESDYSQTMRDNLDLWESAVPDHVWANVVAYDQAIVLLTGIKDGDTSALSAAMDSTELSLVQALEEEDKSERTDDFLEDSIESLTQHFEFIRNDHQQRLLGAVRGDN